MKEAGRVGRDESGHLIVGLMVLVTVMLILLTATAQSWTFLMRRDNEAELIFRGEQYANAIAFYHSETKQYPMDLKLLMQGGPHRHRYIRRLWKDPLAADGKWGLLYMSPTGKGFINPYATRMGKQQFVAGDFNKEEEVESEGQTEQETPAGGLVNRGGLSRRGGPRATGSLGRRNDVASKPGYSEALPSNFDRSTGEIVGLPVVGVVHKKKEVGVKIYKSQAYLNDWAFTLLFEGQDLGMGGSVAPPKGTPKNFGVGDVHAPIYSTQDERPDRPPPSKAGRSSIIERQRAMREKEEEEKKKREEEEAEKKKAEGHTDQSTPPTEQPPPDEGDESEEGDQQPDDEDQGQDQDDEDDSDDDEQDPNAPADPNGSGQTGA